MKIFELLNNKLVISEEAYLISSFRKLWDRDKTKNKDTALSELGYVFFMEDFRSDFSDILNEEERSIEIIYDLNLPKDWKADAFVTNAREFYQKKVNNMLPFLFLQDAKFAVNEMRKYFRNVDFDKKDSKGKSIDDIDKLSRALGKSSEILENLVKLEDMVKKELESKNTSVGGKKKAAFEDGI